MPTVHVDTPAGRELRRWSQAHPDGRVRLAPLGADRAEPRVARWSSTGDPEGPLLKPDLVATGSGVLGAVPRRAGTSPPAPRSPRPPPAAPPPCSSPATRTGRRRPCAPRWSRPPRRLPAASALSAGAGRLVPDPAAEVGLAYDVEPGDYRAWLSADLDGDLNTPSVLLTGTATTAERTITNVSGRTQTFTARARGLELHDVLVSPSAVRLAPGESRTFTISVGRTTLPQPDDDGWVTWRASSGSLTRIAVLVSR